MKMSATDATADATVSDPSAATTYRYTDDSLATKWAAEYSAVASLSTGPPPGVLPAYWDMAVAAAVTAMSGIVGRYIPHVAAARIPGVYDAVVDKLVSLGRDDDARSFRAAWVDLCSTPDGRAVVALCKAAACGGGVTLGLLKYKRTADHPRLESGLASMYKGQGCLPVLQAALRYYRAQGPAPHAADADEADVPSEWPSMGALLHCVGPGGPSPRWYMAVAPAVVAVDRLVARFIPGGVFAVPEVDSIVMAMEELGQEDKVPGFTAAWRQLRTTPQGRAVLALCAVTKGNGVLLGDGDTYLAKVVENPTLESDLAEAFDDDERLRHCLPAMLAALRYFCEQARSSTGGGSGGEGVAAAAAGAGDDRAASPTPSFEYR